MLFKRNHAKKIVLGLLTMKSISLAAAEQNRLASCVEAWDTFLQQIDWQDLAYNRQAESCGCGLIYELPNLLARDGESLALADMRFIPYTEPHYHSEGVYEIYFIMQGSGLVVVGEQEYTVQKGDVVIIPPLTAHYVIPAQDLVLAVVNNPPFCIEDYHVLNETNPHVSFDMNRFLARIAPVVNQLINEDNINVG